MNRLNVSRFFTLLILTPAIAGANDFVPANEAEEEELQFESESGWEGTIGLIYQYNDEQSDLDSESESEITPAFDITYRRGKWSAGTDGLAYGPLSIDWSGNASYEYSAADESAFSGLTLLATIGPDPEATVEYSATDESAFPGLTLSATLSRDPGRDANDPVKGLDRLASGTLFSLSSSYEINDFLSMGVDIERSFSDSKSLLVSGGLNVSFPLSDTALLDLSATTNWANDEHMQAYYGVSASQSARTGLAEYSANSGLLRTSLEASFSYSLTEHWGVNLSASYSRLQSDAAKSPLVSGDTDSSLSLGVGYQF